MWDLKYDNHKIETRLTDIENSLVFARGVG